MRTLWQLMAISHSLIFAEAYTPNAATYTSTATLTTTAGRLYVAGCSWNGTTLRTFTSLVHNAGTNPITFAKRGDITFSTIATPLARQVSCSGIAAASSTAGTVRLTISGSASRASIHISEFNGIDSSAGGGTGLLQTTLTNRTDSAATLTLTFAALGSSNNRMWVANSVNKTATFTPDSNYTEIGDTTNASEALAQETQWDNGSGDLTVTITPSLSGAMGACGLEIVAAAAAAAGRETPVVVMQAVSRSAVR